MKIICDNREQNPLPFKPSDNLDGVIKGTLKVGDYSILGYEDKIAVERKSLPDLFGTLGKGNERFQKELAKTINYDYFCILVEGTFTEARDKDFKNSHFSKMRGDMILQTLFTLQFKYNVHVVFCKDRNEASSYIRKLFLTYEKYKNRESSYKMGDDLELIQMAVKLKKRLFSKR